MEESANVQNDEKNFASMQSNDGRTYNEVQRVLLARKAFHERKSNILATLLYV